VTPEEVAAAAAYLKDTIGKEGVQELIGKLSRDKGHMKCSIFFSFLPFSFLFALQDVNISRMLQKIGNVLAVFANQREYTLYTYYYLCPSF
jgi:hypothetical protein